MTQPEDLFQDKERVDMNDKWKYVCVNPLCGALYSEPQDYCRVCMSDVKERKDKDDDTDKTRDGK